jgi:hypothetical protein
MLVDKIYNTREEWLNALVTKLRPLFERVAAKIPDRVRVAVSLTRSKSAIGTCFDAMDSKDGTYEIIIRIDKDDPLEVAGILVHELIHAAVGLNEKHSGEFKRVALDIGLEGKMTQTVPGEILQSQLESLIKDLDLTRKNSGPKKQNTRLKKVSCKVCEYTVRMTQKWIDVALPNCPMDHGKMSVEEAEGEKEE